MQTLNKSGAAPYWSNTKKQWFNIILSEAYNKKWGTNGYTLPDNARFGISRKDYASHEFQIEMYPRCMVTAFPSDTYCSKKALQEAKNMNLSCTYRANINGLFS